jgi:hypothetical protein
MPNAAAVKALVVLPVIKSVEGVTGVDGKVAMPYPWARLSVTELSDE